MKAPIQNSTNSRKRRVFLVEDHPVTREGFAQLINFQADLAVCGQASSAQEALKEIPRTKADLAIVDISLEGGNGLDLIKDLAAQQAGLPVLVLSMHDEKLYAERAIRAGARGYIMKEEPTAKVLNCIRTILNGHICVSDTIHTQLIGQMSGKKNGQVSGVERLSDRELEVFELLGHGRGTREIAKHLRVSISTVETYRSNIKSKLGLTTAMDLVRAAVRWTEAHD